MDTQAEPAAPLGAAASLSALGATLAETLAARLELALVELREEGERRKAQLALAAIAGFFLALALLLATLFAVVVFWESHRLAAIAGMAAIDVAIAAAAFLRLRHLVAAAPPPFEATLAELAADRDLLRGQGE